jgi:hypothetical protein
MPPALREKRQSGKGRVGQYGQTQRSRPAEAVADPAEKTAPKRPTQEECCLNNRAVMAYSGVGGGKGSKQLCNEGRGDQGVQMHIQTIESPAKPSGDS